MSKVPTDPNMTPEIRRFLDDLDRERARLETLIDAVTTFPGFASQAEAEAGTATDKAANSLRVAQAIAALNPFSNDFIHVQDQKSSGTAGGNFASGAWRTRVLNTAVTNRITGASLASNQVTLPSGTYIADGSAPGFNSVRHQTRIQDITGAATLLTGETSYSASGAINTMTHSRCRGMFTLSISSAIELQHQCSQTDAAGFGNAAVFGTEVYADLMVWRIGS